MMGQCIHCGEALVEVHRTELYVFYACGCAPNASGWTRQTALLDDGEFVLGSAGSLIWACEHCGEEHFRDVYHYRLPFSYQGETCFTCRLPMARIRVDELDSKWRPFWARLGKRADQHGGSVWNGQA